MNMRVAEREEGNCSSCAVPLLSFPPPGHTHRYQGKGEEIKPKTQQRGLHPFGGKGAAPEGLCWAEQPPVLRDTQISST